MTDEHKALQLSFGGQGIVTNTVGEALEFAKMISASKLIPAYAGNPGAILVAMQMGAELGYPPMKMLAMLTSPPKSYRDKAGAVRVADVMIALDMGRRLDLDGFQALQGLAVINGVPRLWGDAMLARVLRSPHFEDHNEWADADAAYCSIKRKDRTEQTRSFSWDQAKKGGLLSKPGPWQSFPDRMLQMRARAFALRDTFADELLGIAMVEELDIIDMGQADFVEPEPQRLSAGRHSVRAPKPSQPEPETPRETPQDRPGSSQMDPRPSQPATPPEMDQNRTEGEIKDSDRVPEAPDAPESDDEPTMITQPRPPEQQPMFELNAGESELLGMVGRVETMAEIDVLIAESGKRRLRKKAKMMIVDAIKRKRAELQNRGKAEPGADG